MRSESSREMELFTAAAMMAEGGRAAFLEAECGADRDLLERVEALLKAHEKVGDFLEEPPGDLPVESVSEIGEKPGDQIGRYRLLRQIGEGGCGVVFMAEQETPVRRRVALKIIKPGMDTKGVIARFEAERQALALMDHPNIAKVFDAGATESGRPYFVMELIRGMKITEYCDSSSLGNEERLTLFVQVCQAVQHAHQKGIIHRDIKPSNILVTCTPEGEPVPMVIDFGIAKATTNQWLTDKTLFTTFEMLVGTPAYMSPEQAALTSVDVDTRTDIYSLGVLLYELLTGTTPFGTEALLKAGPDEIRRAVREKEPARPSTRLETLPGPTLVAVARNRGLEAPKLVRSLKGDLDWIVMKALEKDRRRRYETANGLAVDIQRHLANEAVSARPPSRLYQFQKILQRNKLLFGGLLVFSGLLVAGFVAISLSLAKERQARQEADTARKNADAEKRAAQIEAAKSRQVTGFLRQMLEGVGPSVAMGRDTKMLRDILDRTVTRIPADLTNQPAVESELLFTLGTVYEDLDAFSTAEGIYRRVLEINRTLFPEDSSEIATDLNRLGLTLLRQRKLDEAERHIEAALKLSRKLRGDEHLETVASLENLAMVRWHQNRLADAEKMMREVYAARRRLMPKEHPALLNALNNLGNVLHSAGRHAEAEQVYRQVLAEKLEYLGEDNPALGVTLHNLGAVLLDEGKHPEAEEFFSRAVQLRRKVLGENHPRFFVSLDGLADVHRIAGSYVDAESLYREALKLERRQLEAGDPRLIRTVANLATVLLAQKKPHDIELLFAEILTPEFMRTPESVPLLTRRMEFLARAGRWHEAAADAARVVELRPADHMHCHALAPLLVAEGDLESYRKISGSIMERFGSTKDVYIADRMAKDCLIHPAAGVDLSRVAAMADIAVTSGKNQPAFPFFLFCKALAEYRRGNFEAALELARKPGESTYSHVAIEAAAVSAMAQFRLNRQDAARDSLAKGASLFETRLPKLESGDIGDDWRDWIIARALLTEARLLIHSEAAADAKQAKF